MTIVTQPFLQFHDRAGAPLEAGYIYIGQPGFNPEVAPITVYWDRANDITAVQPIRTIGGYASRNGSPANVIASQAPYSIVIKDRDGTLVYSSLSYDPSDVLSLTVNRQLITATNGQTVVSLATAYIPGDNNLLVYLNGLLMETPGDYAETTTTSITFASPLVAGDEIAAIIRG